MSYTNFLSWLYSSKETNNIPGAARQLNCNVIDITDCMIVVNQADLVEAISKLRKTETAKPRTTWDHTSPLFEEMHKVFEEKKRRRYDFNLKRFETIRNEAEYHTYLSQI